MILPPVFFIAIFILPCASLPTGNPRQFSDIETECAVYNNENKCPPGHELTECGDKYAGLYRCSPCKENWYQCDFITPEFRVQCQPPSCPDLGTETFVKVLHFENKTCHLTCVCNETNGYTGKSGSKCTKHPVCGLNKELKNGTCVDCGPGFHNPSTDYGPCVAEETTTPSTSSPVPQSTPGRSSIPSDHGPKSDVIIWILVPSLIMLFIVILVMVWCCCKGQRQACNMACCNSTAIQNSPSRQQNQDAETTENPPPYTYLPNGALSSGIGGHQPNGISSIGPNGVPAARTNGIPGPRPNGIPRAPGNQTPGSRQNGIPSSGNQTPGSSSNGIPGARGNVNPGASANQISTDRPNGMDEDNENDGDDEDDENATNASHSSSERPAPTGTADPSTTSLASHPSPLYSEDDTIDHVLLSEPLTSDSTSLNLPRQTQDPEQTRRKMPIPAQDIGTASGDANDDKDDDDDDKQESQGLLSGAVCGLVELDNDRDLSHVPLVQ